MLLDQRKHDLLLLVIEEHIKTAQPIGSQAVVDHGALGLSAPTIRNEMRELEELGYLAQPHTSAGRVPTEIGYRYYVSQLNETVSDESLYLHDIQTLHAQQTDGQAKIKLFAKYAAEMTGNTAIVAFNRHSLYYTGISNLFSQPEFIQFSSAADISTVLDQCEERLDDMMQVVHGTAPQTLVGKENPLGAMCSIVSMRFGPEGLFCILGPMRMNYKKNQTLARVIQKYLSQ